jgi:Fe-S cluster assembly protein SufD
MNQIANKSRVEELQWAINPASFQREIGETELCQLVEVFVASGVIKQEFNLTVAGSNLELLLIYIGTAQHYLNLTVQVNHLVAQTKAKVRLKAILWGESRLEFKGNIWVPAEAAGTDTYLKCETLLMSPQAQAKAIPALEIIASDVKAGHAASVGRVDEDALFYLETRGFDKKQAQKLLIEAFLAESKDFFADLPDAEKQHLLEKISSYLPEEINL